MSLLGASSPRTPLLSKPTNTSWKWAAKLYDQVSFVACLHYCKGDGIWSADYNQAMTERDYEKVQGWCFSNDNSTNDNSTTLWHCYEPDEERSDCYSMSAELHDVMLWGVAWCLDLPIQPIACCVGFFAGSAKDAVDKYRAPSEQRMEDKGVAPASTPVRASP